MPISSRLTAAEAIFQGNYTVSFVPGTLTVDPGTMTLTATGYEGKYDGAAHGGTVECSVSTARILYSTDGETWTETAPTVTHVADGPLTVFVKAEDSNHKTATASYTLQVLPRSVTLTSANDSKVYDGTPLTNSTVTVGGDGFVKNEGAIPAFTGSQTLVGSSENSFRYTLTEGTKAENYEIATSFGTLTVTAPESFDFLTKTHTAAGEYRLGDTVVFEITVENIFDAEATALIAEQEGVSILTDGGKVSSVTLSIPAGGSVTLRAEYVIREQDLLSGSFTNQVIAQLSATVDGTTQETADEAEDTVTELDVPKAILEVEKSVTGRQSVYRIGDWVEYRITVRNLGNVTGRGAVLTDILDAAGDAVEWTDLGGGLLLSASEVRLPDLAPGASVTLTCRYRVDAGDEALTVGNTARVTSTDGTVTHSDTETVQVEDIYDLTIYYLTDDWQLELRQPYRGRYRAGDSYYVVSPAVAGYEPNYTALGSGTAGMPARDVTLYVLYSPIGGETEPTEPEETTEPTEPEETTEPTEPQETYDITEVTEESRVPGYDLSELQGSEVPLGGEALDEDHTCCILHFLIMTVAAVVLGFSIGDRKKRKAIIRDMKRLLAYKQAGMSPTSDRNG